MDDLKRKSMGQQVKGAAENLKGRVKEAAGDLTNNPDLEAEGQMDQAKGNIRKGVGKVGEGISDALNDRD